MQKLIFFILAVSLLLGCASSSQINLTVASDRDMPENISILKKGVFGEDCSSTPGFYGSYATAIDNALKQVEGANVLVNAKFSRKEMPIFIICVMVEGDAGKI